MPDIIVTSSGEPVGRLSCTQEFADKLADAMLNGARFELSGGVEARPDKPSRLRAQLKELLVSPLPPDRAR